MQSKLDNKSRIGVWFSATFLMFFGRALMYSTWVSRGPEVKKLLSLNNFEFGALSILYPLGGLIVIKFASSLVRNLSSRVVATICCLSGGALFFALGIAVTHGNLIGASAILIFLGGAMAILDYVGNFEGNLVDKASRRSLFSAIHSAYGLGMMIAATLAATFSSHKVSIQVNNFGIAIIALLCGGFAYIAIPRHEKVELSQQSKKLHREQNKAAWREPRSRLIVLVAAAFMMSELSAGVWVPIALTHDGFSTGKAALALSLLWVVITFFRAIGGVIVDAIGRYRAVKYSAVLTGIGISLFIANHQISIPYIALFIWGAGTAIGFPMCVSALGDDPVLSPARINMIITIVYVVSICVGPVLGTLSQFLGVYLSFAIPVILCILAFKFSYATKPEAAIEGDKHVQ
jgi:MFS family permease